MSSKIIWTDKQRIEFAKQVEHIFNASYPGLRKILTLTFLKGVATGLGVFLGGTIVVALLLWLLSGLGHVPFIKKITEPAKQTLQQSND